MSYLEFQYIELEVNLLYHHFLGRLKQSKLLCFFSRVENSCDGSCITKNQTKLKARAPKECIVLWVLEVSYIFDNKTPLLIKKLKGSAV